MAIHIKKDLQFRDYYFLIIQHKLQIISSVVCFVAATWFFVSRNPDYFTSYSQLTMEDSQESVYLGGPSKQQKSLGYYTGIFQGRAFQDKLFSSMDSTIIPGNSSREKKLFVAANVKIEPGTHSSFIKISASVTSPKLAYDLVRIATDSLIVFCKKVENQESDQALSVIKEQIEKTTQMYNESVEEKNTINQKESQGDISGLQALETAYENMLVEYELESADLAAKKSYFSHLDKKINRKLPIEKEGRRELLSKLEKLNREKQKKIKLGIPISDGDSLLIEIENVQNEISELSKKSTTSKPNVGFYAKWKESKKNVEDLEAELQFKMNKIKSFRKAIDEYKKSHPNILEHELEVNRLNELINRHSSTYKRLTIRLEDEIIKMQAQSGGLKIVENAFMPTEPNKTNDIIYYLFSFVVGLILGIVIALFREFLNDSIKSTEDIEKRLALTLMGTIPHIVTRKSDLKIKRSTSEKKGQTLSQQYPDLIIKGGKGEGIIAESYRSLRTNILFASPDKHIQTFIVTSCGPHEGKSLTSSNTALAFAQQGEPTLLVDTDLRRPIIHHLFKLERGPGVGDLITDSTTIEESIRKIEGTSLHILPAGTFLPNAAEVLGSKKFLSLVELFKQKYKYIIFDTPPIIAVTDACVLASHVDGVVLVTRAEKTSLNVAERSVQALNRVKANIFGCVLNDVPLSKNKGYYGYYKNYYQYYHTTKD